MKKVLYCTLAAAGVMSLASCSNDDAPMPAGDGVNITVKLPRDMATRGTFGDGTDDGDRAILDNLQWSVFEVLENGTRELVFSDGRTAFGSSQTEELVSLPLAKGKTYQVAFYADDKDNAFVTYSDGNISVDYTKGVSNTAAEDAFIGKSEVFTVTGAYSETVTLTRPFAQLNWGTDDTEAKVLNKVIQTLTAEVAVTKGLYTGMNVISGETIGEPVATPVKFAAVEFTSLPGQAFPVKKDDVNAEPYLLVAMNYLLTGNGTIDCELSFNNGLTPVTVNAAPVQVNHRTNIYGSLLTAPGEFNIKVDNNFLPEDNNIKIVTKASELADALNKGGDIEIPAGATVNLEDILGTPNDTPAINVTKPTSLEVKGKLECGTGGQIQVKSHLSISGTGSIDTGIRGAFNVTTGGTLEAKDVTFNSPKAYRGGDVWNEGGGSMTFTNVTFNSNMATVYFQPAGEDDTLTMTGCVVNNTSKNSIVNPETNSRVWSYAIRVQGGKAVLKDLTVNAVQGAVAVGRGAVCDIMSGTYTVNDSEPGKGDGFYCVYVAREGIANVYDGKFASVRISVFNGNEDVAGDKFGFVNLFGGKYSSKGVNQSGEAFTLPEGYEYVPLTGEDPYKWEVVKSNS